MIKPKTKFIKNPIYLSYTSLKDFLKCPNSYYLKNIYRDPKTAFRIQIASPYLTLGSTVHDSVKWYLDNKGQAAKDQLMQKFRNFWLKYRGKKGGFATLEEEGNFGNRGLKMLDNFLNNAQRLEKSAPAVTFPKYNLVEDIVLIGNFDFVGEKVDGSLHVVDFKTGANDEKDSLQLYIYAILAEVNLEKEVSAASFWYLDRDDSPRQIVLDPLEGKLKWICEKAKELKAALQKNEWVCIKKDRGFCRDCRDHQAILDGKGEFQFSDYRYKKDIYYLPR